MLFLIILLGVGVGIVVLAHLVPRGPGSTIYGVSFSPRFMGSLDINPWEAYQTILDEWGFRHIRLSAPWDAIEPEPGKFDFAELDWQMNEAGKRDAKIVLVVGQKIPRWPECHVPAWAFELPENEYRAALKGFMSEVVKRYHEHPALEIWQIENEPFLEFGKKCRATNRIFLREEIALVKELDNKHPTLVSDSGELSTWLRTARSADVFGTTLYRVVWNKYIGYWNYDWLPPGFYNLKLWFNRRAPTSAYVMELQAEPWLPNGLVTNTPLEEQYRSMSLERLKKNIQYNERLGFPRSYLWGAEWWYWLKNQGHPEIAEYVKQLRKE